MTYAEMYSQRTAVDDKSIQKMQSEFKHALGLVMGDSSAEMLDEMASIFLEDAVPLLDQIKSGYANRDLNAVGMAAHALKGSSATIGLDQFASICLAVENDSKQNEASKMHQHLAELESEYSQIKRALSAFLL